MSGIVNFQSDPQVIWEYFTTVSGKTAFDIGANGGLVSTVLAERFEQVIAIEPAAESFTKLVTYVPENVTCHNCAVSAETGIISLRETTLTTALGELFTGDTMPWGETLGYRDIGAFTLDYISDMHGFPDFIKIDTEGHEVEILQGGPETFLTDPAFVIEIHSEEKGRTIRGWLDDLGLAYETHNHEAYKDSSPHHPNHYWIASPAERLR